MPYLLLHSIPKPVFTSNFTRTATARLFLSSQFPSFFRIQSQHSSKFTTLHRPPPGHLNRTKEAAEEDHQQLSNSKKQSFSYPLSPSVTAAAMDLEEERDDPVSVYMTLDDWPHSRTETYMVGFVLANIVGLKYYSGRITGRELVGLVREPLNPYDGNAIKVLNTLSVQVGHIERSVAAVLSPLIDSHRVTVEGIVPNSGAKNKFRISCQVHLFARLEDFEVVRSAISGAGMVLLPPLHSPLGSSDAMVVRERSKERDGVKSLDEVFKLADERARKEGQMGHLEPPTEVIKSPLFPHQKEALWWLVNRENSTELPPFWEERDGEYVNVLTNFHTGKRPEPLRGGILADDMGLGKTLTLLSLIALDKCGGNTGVQGGDGDSKLVEEASVDKGDGESVLSGKKGKRSRMTGKGARGQKKPKIDKSSAVIDEWSGILGAKTTLIVCPPAVFSTWIAQLEEHTHQGSFKVYMYYGSNRTKEVEELCKHDIVLTTFSTLAVEDRNQDSPMDKIEWRRVILDEAHLIKNASAQQSQAATKLKARRRWVVTGTPIQNGSFDLFSLMSFLRFEPFSIKSYWRSLLQRPLAAGDKTGLTRLQVLMATISLRRTKDKAVLNLPSKTFETCYVELSGEERELYDQMEGEAKGVIQNFINDDSMMRNYSTVLCLILRLRQICNDLALCPSDLRSLLPSASIEDVSDNPDLLTKLVSVLQAGEDFDCPICISSPTDVVITCCAHIFCRPCILKTLQRTKPCCPLCRHPLSMSDLFSAPPEFYSNNNIETSSSATTSSKVSALLKLLVASRTENPSMKSVVFSQFQKMLVLLEEPLKALGFKILRLDGSMNAKRRAQIIKEFGILGPETATVLLASLKASGAGINLTAASRVYLFEPWWNPAVEEQAMDRVHRIGQKEDVRIVRLIARNSIEERILEMQERKKTLAKEAFGRRGKKGQNEASMDDIRTILSL
ncbi:hypothetical protein Tsubulata_003573 [Turnera subulata]|uniref:SWI/SNF-related matrix-associated actin-dependent regulator of chromatin subfamily A member 3-like 1 n=1 Tax=Turnera subulata TaxID=218843 RepID=A0A9Q0G9P8_9ROSI|nr:hypothetical protein Tsubulata_003573 [Turnera subulata]